MATVTKTIGTSSRDYSTITSWESDLDNTGVYSSGDDAVGECYNDSAFDESVTIDGGGTVGLNSVTLTVAAGERHDGTAGTGARIVRTGGTNIIRLNDGPDRRLSWLECEFATTGANNAVPVQAAAALAEVDHCIVHATSHSSPDQIKWGIEEVIAVADSITRVSNNIVYGLNRNASSDSAGINAKGSTTPNAYVFNNTVHAMGNTGSGDAIGVLESASGSGTDREVVNNLCTDCKTDFSTGSNITAESHNASSDATASGTGSLTNITTADQYVSTTSGSEDLHLKSGADCIDAGTDLGTTPTGVNIDIDGEDRTSVG